MSNSPNSSNQPDLSSQKRYSLVKWLENCQFDVDNEWLGRLTSVPHTNIIDFDADELKAGIEINVIRNNGEIWRAQVIIPKTSSNTIDLPPSTNKKIRTKVMPTTKVTFDLTEQDIIHSDNEYTQHETKQIDSEESLKDTKSCLTKSNQKEWQFLQTAINEAGLTDFYQTYNDLTNNNSPSLPLLTSNQPQSNNELTIDTILQMQSQLLEQQKDLKSIELETMDHLRHLHQNINKLASKFDSFEQSLQQQQQNNNNNNGLKAAKNVFNKLNSTIGQQLKLVDSQLLKEISNNNSTSPSISATTKTLIDLNESNTNVNNKQGIQTQISLNRFLRESVKQLMGCDFLIKNAVSDIPINIMRTIKKEAFDKYLPHDRRPIKAWGLAMASLRCLKRDLVKNKNKQLANQNAVKEWNHTKAKHTN